MKAITACEGFQVDEWMAKWTYETGFPIVSVEVSEESNEFVARQTPVGGGDCTPDSAWWIPICFKTKVM